VWSGIFQSGIADYDKVQCYANIKTVQKLLGAPGQLLHGHQREAARPAASTGHGA
jgi:ABC-type lipoprotein release transport system permease subunit